MRRDSVYHIFAGHFDWYTIDPKKGFIPTEKAPKEAVEAMKRHNATNFPEFKS